MQINRATELCIKANIALDNYIECLCDKVGRKKKKKLMLIFKRAYMKLGFKIKY